MSLDMASIHQFISAELGSSHTISQSMERVIDECSQQSPHDDWTTLRELPYDAIDELRDWIATPFILDPPKTALAGLWFGLFNPEYDGKGAADIYVCGSHRFFADPNDNSWAVGPDWWPEHRYAHSSLLRDLYQIAYRRGGLGNDAEYPLCLGYGGFVIRDLLRGIRPETMLAESISLGVAVGFDSGDFVLVGTLTRRGLQPA